MNRKHMGKSKDDSIQRIEQGIRTLGGGTASLRHESKDPLLVEVFTLENIANAVDALVAQHKKAAAPAKAPVQPKQESHREIIQRITGVDGFEHPELLILVEEDGNVIKVTKKLLAAGIKEGAIEAAWEGKALRLATEAPAAPEEPAKDPETGADTSDGHDESPAPTGDAPKEPA